MVHVGSIMVVRNWWTSRLLFSFIGRRRALAPRPEEDPVAMDSGQEDFVAMAEYPKPNIQGAVFSPRQFSLGMNLVECELEKEW